MRKYPEKYLEVLKNEVMEIENNGLKIILKPSPGEKREGYLDPCEKLIMEGHWASKTSSDKEVIEEKENLDTESKGQAPSSDMIISMIRDSMGFANYNLRLYLGIVLIFKNKQWDILVFQGCPIFIFKFL